MTAHEVWCSAKQETVTVQGEITLLVNALEELHVKQCLNEPHCTMKNRVDCVVGKRLQGGKW